MSSSLTSNILNDRESWPIAIDNSHNLLDRASAPPYPQCYFCPCISLKKCNLCQVHLCLDHESRFPIENECCTTFQEKAYYSSLTLCTTCRDMQMDKRRLRVMTCFLILFLAFIFFIIIVLTHA